MSVRILLIDADEPQRDASLIAFSAAGYEATPASDIRQALALILAAPPDIICCDVRVAGSQGPDCMREITQRAPEATVLVTHLAEDHALALEATQRGAFDILEKPLRAAELRLRLQNAYACTERNRQNHALRRELARFVGDHPIVAASDSMIDLLESLEQAASHNKSVLLTGEAGTGKELLARVIHAQSKRRSQDFVTTNCAQSPGTHLSTQLFGGDSGSGNPATRSRRGVFTDADRGTLFLDHICELPEAVQAQLFQHLGEQMFQPTASQSKRAADVRLICATHHDVEESVSNGRLREDLYAQIAEVRLVVPPLRERQKDIPLLVDHFLEHYRLILSRPVRGIAEDALERLVAYRWPGNIRELENICERAMISARGDRVTIGDLPRDLVSAPRETEEDFGLKRGRRVVEIDIIRRALRATGGNRTHAAKRLEISHRALLYKLKQYAIRD
jgi:two-component system response regulator AtoC